MRKIGRKSFLKMAGLASIAAPAVLMNSCTTESEKSRGPAIHSDRQYRWKMVTTWPPNFPVLGQGANLLASWVKEMSEEQLDIQVFGGGELVPPLEAFDAVSGGMADIATGAAYYWAGKNPATQFFASVPFGMNAQQMNAWLQVGGGMQLWQELYANYNLIPFAAGNTGVQMGGWFNKEMNTIEDFQGLKMRMPGLGGKVIEKAGGSAVLSAGSEIYTNLERGVIDATEWIGPYHDYKMGFHKIAKYCYFPGWHEPGSTLEAFVNKNTFESLPAHLQQILTTAIGRLNQWSLAEFEGQNALYLKKLKEEGEADFRPFSEDILSQLKIYAGEVIADITQSDAFSKKVYDSFRKFQKTIKPWADMTERAYYEFVS